MQDQGFPAYGRMRERVEGSIHLKHASPSRRAMRPSYARMSRPEGARLPQEGSRECRTPDASAASCARGSGRCTRVFTAVTPEQPGIPARNGFTVSFVISPAIGFLDTVISRIKVLPGPVEPNAPPQDLTPASRRQDHTTSPYAATRLVQKACWPKGFAGHWRRRLACWRSLTESNPPCDPIARLTLPRPPHLIPRP